MTCFAALVLAFQRVGIQRRGDALTILLNIDVPDLTRAERFYTRAFGLTAGRRFGADVVELLGWPTPLYLLKKDVGTIGAGVIPRRYDRHWTPVHLDIVVEDLDLALDRAVEAGATVEYPPRDAPYGRIAMLADPFGHGFCLITFNAAGYDSLLELGEPSRAHGSD